MVRINSSFGISPTRQPGSVRRDVVAQRSSWPLRPGLLSYACRCVGAFRSPRARGRGGPDCGSVPPAVAKPTTANLLVEYFQDLARGPRPRSLPRSRRRALQRGDALRHPARIRRGSRRVGRRSCPWASWAASTQSNRRWAGPSATAIPIVRKLAEDALWSVWFRADTPEHNQIAPAGAQLIGREQLDQAEALATRLIVVAPRFAEAYNQRAIIYFQQGRFAESVQDCQRVLTRNPYHFGAISADGPVPAPAEPPGRRPQDACAGPEDPAVSARRSARTSSSPKAQLELDAIPLIRAITGLCRRVQESGVLPLFVAVRGRDPKAPARPVRGRWALRRDGRCGPAKAATTSGSAPRWRWSRLPTA